MLSILAKRRRGRRDVRFVPSLNAGRSDALEARSLTAPLLLRNGAFKGVKAWSNQTPEPATWIATNLAAEAIVNRNFSVQNPFTGATASVIATGTTLISDNATTTSGSPGLTISTGHDHQESLTGNWSLMPDVTVVQTNAKGEASYNIIDQASGLPTTYNGYGQFQVTFTPSSQPVDEVISLYFSAPGVYAAINFPGDPSSTNNLHLIYATPSGPVEQIIPNFAIAGGSSLITYDTSGSGPINIIYQSSLKTTSHTPIPPTYPAYASHEQFTYTYNLSVS